MEKKYLFKRAADGKWIFGRTVNSVCKAGLYRIDPLLASDNFVIYAVYSRDISVKYPDTFSNYKKENGAAYANVGEFLAATVEFFDPGTAAGGGGTTAGLTNTELRATPIPVSQATQPLPTGAATSAKQSDGTQKTQNVDAAGINSESRFRVLKQLVTRPGNVTPVIANGTLTDINALISKFANANKAAGYGLMISDVRIQTNDTGVAGKTFRVHFYDDVVDPTAYNIAFALDNANVGKRRGKIEVTFPATGNLVKVASNLVDGIIIAPAGTDLYFKLECVEGYTPSANSTWFEVELGVVQTN